MADNLQILAGSPVRQDPSVLTAHLSTLKGLILPKGVEMDLAFVDDNENPEASEVLLSAGGTILPADPRPDAAAYGIASTHIWNGETLLHLGRQKQRLLNLARDREYDAFFLVDSDLLLDPITLESLLSLKVDIASAVFWTRWQADQQQPLPQVWLRNPGEMEGLGRSAPDFLDSLTRRQISRVIGGGACCLYRTGALAKGPRFSPPHPFQPMDGGGMWAGEDRTMSLACQSARIQQWADPWPDIFHAYHPHQRVPEVLTQVLEVLNAPRQTSAKYGDLVSFVLEPLEIPQLANSGPDIKNVRGRLGQLRLFPELEAALLNMESGDEQILELSYPHWFKVKEFAGKRKMVMLKLLDVKPFGYPPELSDYMFRGLR